MTLPGTFTAGLRAATERLEALFNLSLSALANCGLWTLSCDFAHTINGTLKWLTQLPTLMQNHSGGDSVASRC